MSRFRDTLFPDHAHREERSRETVCADSIDVIRLIAETRDMTPTHHDSDREVWLRLGEKRLYDWLVAMAKQGGADLP